MLPCLCLFQSVKVNSKKKKNTIVIVAILLNHVHYFWCQKLNTGQSQVCKD